MIHYSRKIIEIGAQDVFPYSEFLKSKMGAIVLHYKFLSNERKDILKIVTLGTYDNNSSMFREYDRLFYENKDLNPHYKGTREWKGTVSFSCFYLIKSLALTDSIK